MEIATQLAEALSPLQIRRAADKSVQNVFSEVLRGAGRAGFASAVEGDLAKDAAEGSTSRPLEERIQQSWDDWYQTTQLGRYASPQAPVGLRENFGHILHKAYQQGGYVAPHAFLSGLSDSELTTVQRAHLLADPIQVDSLSEEGALNLLLPAAAQSWLDHLQYLKNQIDPARYAKDMQFWTSFQDALRMSSAS